MNKTFFRYLSLILAIVMVMAIVCGCEKAPADDGEKENDNTQTSDNQNNQNDNTEPDVDDGKIVITDTFYPQYPNNEKEYKDMKANVKEWFYSNLEVGKLFSVVVGEDNIDAISARWKKDIKTDTNADGHETVKAVFTDETAKIKYTLDAVLYKDYPTVDYVITLENIGQETSPMISDFYAIDTYYDLPSNKGYTLHTSKGSNAGVDDFETVEQAIVKSDNWYTYTPFGGRSSNRAWPYFDVIGKNCGFLIAIGWSGQWEASFSNRTIGKVDMRVRQQSLHTVLYAGESIRSPRIVMTYFDGDADYGHNVFRKLIVEHYTPNDGTENRFVSPLCINFWGGRTENYIKNIIDRYDNGNIYYDAVWMDAGWYGDYPNLGDNATTANSTGNSWSTELGWYTVNKKLFPSGTLTEIGKAAAKNGHNFLLWYMIEDGCNTYADKLVLGRDSYYPIVYSFDENQRLVLKLSDDAVLQKVLDLFAQKFQNEGVTWIRCDFWSNPINAWLDYDIVESHEIDQRVDDLRQGITENKYIVNLYKLWDTMYEKYPGFLLDNCCSGGRRLDIEMEKRGVPLWRTDYETSDLPAMQAQTQWISYWIPFSATGVVYGGSKSYGYRSLLSSSCSMNSNTPEGDIPALYKAVEEFKTFRPYWYGSYYQIIKPDYNQESWNAYELYRDDWQKGIMVLIRRPSSSVDTVKIKFKGLMENQNYLVHDFDAPDTSEDFVKTGDELMNKGINFGLATGTIKIYQVSLVTE